MRTPAVSQSVLPHVLAVAALTTLIAAAAAPAHGGVIVPASAAGTLTLTDFNTSATTPLTFPSANGFSFTSPVIGGGVITGSYAFADGVQDTLSVSVQENSGRTGARTTLTLAFTSARDATFTVSASAIGVTSFIGMLDGVVANQFNTFGSPPSGNIPPLTPLTLSGFLPAGAHTYSVDYVQAPIPNAPFETSGLASFTVTLAPVVGPVVPLPAAVWPGLALAGGMIASRARRGRQTTTCRGRGMRCGGGGGIGTVLVIAVAALLTAALPARAAFISGLVNIDFDSPSTPTYGGAAVLGSPGDLWNRFDSPSGVTNAPLFLSTGAPSDARLSYPTVQLYSSGPSVTGPYVDLFGDGIDNSGPPGTPLKTVRLSGLAPGATYQLIVYGRFGTLSVGGVTTELFATDAELAAALVAGKNYAAFSPVADAAGGVDILFGPGATIVSGQFAGLQISAAPPGPVVPLPPAVWSGLTCGGAALIGAARLRRRVRPSSAGE